MNSLGRPLPRSFYARHCVAVARAVLGRVLVFDGPNGPVAGRIVEVEAYRGRGDAASHAHRGRTPRNAVMFGAPGRAYVYFTYGMHHCLNLVTEPSGSASAVLVRALEPVEGIEAMRRRRASARPRSSGVRRVPLRDHDLARGPGNVTRALGLTRAHNGLDLTRGPLWLSDRAPERGGCRVGKGPRVGIRHATTRAWRFFLDPHPSVSAGPRAIGRPRRASATAHATRPARADFDVDSARARP